MEAEQPTPPFPEKKGKKNKRSRYEFNLMGGVNGEVVACKWSSQKSPT